MPRTPTSHPHAPAVPALSRPRPSRRHLLAATAAVGGLALAACSPSSGTGQGGADAQDGITVTDWSGAEVHVPRPAQRVVCLDGTGVDALAELGLEPVGAQPHRTVLHKSFHGPDAATEQIGGTFFEPDLEQILSLRPDLVLGSASVHGGLRDALGGVPLFVHAFSAEQAGENLERIAALLGREEQAASALSRWEETLAAYDPFVEGADGSDASGAEAPAERNISVLSMYGGATKDIGIDAADSAIGAVLSLYTAYPWPNASEGDSGFLELSIEEVVSVDPQHVWVLDFAFDPDAPPLLETLAQNPAWQELTAVQKERVHGADPSWWGVSSGTRAQQMLLDAVMPVVYPEQFPTALSGL